MDPLRQIRLLQRRTFLGQATRGIGSVALASLINPALASAAPSGGRARKPSTGPAWSTRATSRRGSSA